MSVGICVPLEVVTGPSIVAYNVVDGPSSAHTCIAQKRNSRLALLARQQCTVGATCLLVPQTDSARSTLPSPASRGRERN